MALRPLPMAAGARSILHSCHPFGVATQGAQEPRDGSALALMAAPCAARELHAPYPWGYRAGATGAARGRPSVGRAWAFVTAWQNCEYTRGTRPFGSHFRAEVVASMSTCVDRHLSCAQLVSLGRVCKHRRSSGGAQVSQYVTSVTTPCFIT